MITFKQSQVLTFWTFFTWGFRGTFWGPEMKRLKLATYKHLAHGPILPPPCFTKEKIFFFFRENFAMRGPNRAKLTVLVNFNGQIGANTPILSYMYPLSVLGLKKIQIFQPKSFGKKVIFS